MAKAEDPESDDEWGDWGTSSSPAKSTSSTAPVNPVQACSADPVNGDNRQPVLNLVDVKGKIC